MSFGRVQRYHCHPEAAFFAGRRNSIDLLFGGNECERSGLGLDVGYALGARLGKVFFVPGDAAVGGIDDVPGFR